MRIKLIISIVALMSVFMGLSFLVPGLVDLYYNNKASAMVFFSSGIFVSAISLLVYWSTRPKQDVYLKMKEMFLTTTLIWLMYSLIAALPIYLDIANITIVDAFFESMSGLTTTGATVIKGLDYLPKGLLMWRAMLQWMGGIGIIVVVLNVFPNLRIGGMQFFSTEFSGDAIRETPTVIQTIRFIVTSFVVLSLLCAFSLWFAGMSIFDSLTHAMTTISTGGFSTHDSGVSFYDSPQIEWVLIFFMFVAGLPLVLWSQIFSYRWFMIKRNVQIRTYVKFVAIALVVLVVGRLIGGAFLTNSVIRSSLFSILSVLTTTGFVVQNYELWGAFSTLFFLFILSVGACTGSTSGGVKMFRFAIVWEEIVARLKIMIQPRAVVVPRYGNKTISDDVGSSVLFFLGLYFLSVCICTLMLSLTGVDVMTSLSGALTAVANVGPGLGKMIGPDCTFSELPALAKIIISFAMLLGRLEFTSIIVLFLPFLWRKNT